MSKTTGRIERMSNDELRAILRAFGELPSPGRAFVKALMRSAPPETEDPFAGTMTEKEYLDRRNIGRRAAQLERQQGRGPPYIKIGN
jgi:hypothetical protein